VVLLKASAWAKAGVVMARLTIEYCSVPLSSTIAVAHNTTPLLPLAQEMELPIQPFRISGLRMASLLGTTNSRTWRSRRDVPGGQSLYDLASVSYVGHRLCHSISV